jgi:hypothetical protein
MTKRTWRLCLKIIAAFGGIPLRREKLVIKNFEVD